MVYTQRNNPSFSEPIKGKTSSSFLPRITKTGFGITDISVRNSPEKKTDYKMTKLVNDLEESIKEQFAVHNQKFDANTDIVINKSISDLNVSLLNEYFLPKLKVFFTKVYKKDGKIWI